MTIQLLIPEEEQKEDEIAWIMRFVCSILIASAAATDAHFFNQEKFELIIQFIMMKLQRSIYLCLIQ